MTNSNEGEGLLFYGNTIIPFKDKFDASLKLYSLMTTKPNEMGKYTAISWTKSGMTHISLFPI